MTKVIEFYLNEDTVNSIVRDAEKEKIDLNETLISVIVQLPGNVVALGTGVKPISGQTDDSEITNIDIEQIEVPLKSISYASAAFITGKGSTIHSVRVGPVTRTIVHNH